MVQPNIDIPLRNAAGMTASVVAFGAVLRDLAIPLPEGGVQHVVLGYDDPEAYRDNPAHFGATAGRFANRIGGGRFSLDGVAYQLDLNENGRGHLHGGAGGFAHLPWQVVSRGEDTVTLALVSEAGDQGYPGRVEARCTYTLLAPATLRIEMTATTDAPTLVNLAHHSYFTLEPGHSVRELEVEIAASRYTPVDGDMIPTGELAPVAGTPFDFRTPQRLDARGSFYDVNFALDRADADAEGLAFAARVRSPSGLGFEVWTTEPGVQLYDGRYIPVERPGLGGAPLFPHAGLCLEAQKFPDAPNHPHFPSAVLRPGETYRQVTEYRFAVG